MRKTTNSGACDLIIDQIQKNTYVLHESQWHFTTDWHSHHKGQLLYVEQGMQYLYTNKNNFLLPAHHCAWIPSDTIHKTSCPTSEGFFRSIFFTMNDDSDPFFSEINVFKVPEVLREMILYSERWSKSKVYHTEETVFLQAILSNLPNFCNESLPLVIPVPKHPLLITVSNYLMHALDTPVNLTSISEKYNITTRTLQRLFKKEMGMSMAKYLKTIRIIKSIELLGQKGENVSSVTYKVGYESVSTFSNNFLKLVGKRPQEFLIP